MFTQLTKKFSGPIFLVLGILSLTIVPLQAEDPLDLDRLSENDIKRVQNLLDQLTPLMKEREARENLATLTFPELYAPLDQENKTFLKKFEDLKAEDLKIKIPFRGMATGAEDLVVIKGQKIKMEQEEKELPPQYLPKGVHERYEEMMAAMQKDLGKRLYVESGYRSSAYQLYLFIFYLKNHDYSLRETARFVTLPGYSEHGAPDYQAIDFINEDGISGETHAEEFENLEEYKWLLKNASRFDFVLSYPRNAPAGITFEPWHWRYERGIESEINEEH